MNHSATSQPASNSPTHIAYHVRNREGGEAFWTLIGSAWAHADGEGFNIRVDAVPVDGRITLRTLSNKKK